MICNCTTYIRRCVEYSGNSADYAVFCEFERHERYQHNIDCKHTVCDADHSNKRKHKALARGKIKHCQKSNTF